MNIDTKHASQQLSHLAQKLSKYLWLFVFVGFVSLYGFLVMRVNTLTAQQPSDAAVAEKLKTVQRPRIDENAAIKMQQLEDQNVNVQTLFNDARQNPFAE